MATARVYADFQNADPQGRLRLICAGTVHDLALQKVELRNGLPITLYSDDSGEADELEVVGVVEYSADERCWVARIDWGAIRRAADDGGSHGGGMIPDASLPNDVGLPSVDST
jgi:hypothetical protein